MNGIPIPQPLLREWILALHKKVAGGDMGGNQVSYRLR
jgi:hypothetical protein